MKQRGKQVGQTHWHGVVGYLNVLPKGLKIKDNPFWHTYTFSVLMRITSIDKSVRPHKITWEYVMEEKL